MSMESQESRKEHAPLSPPLRERKPKPPLAPKPPPPKRPPVAEVKPLRSQGYIMGRVPAETTERRSSEGREWKLLMRTSGKAELSRLEGPSTLAWRQSGSLFYLHSEAPRRASLSRVDAERCRHSEIDGGTWRAIDSNESSYSKRVKGTGTEGQGRQEHQQGSFCIIGSANKNKITQKGEGLFKEHTVSIKDATKEEVSLEDLNARTWKAEGGETEAISSVSEEAMVTEVYELIPSEEEHLDSEVSNIHWNKVTGEIILKLGQADQQMSKEEQGTQRISHSQSLDEPSAFPVLVDNASVNMPMSGETPGVEHYGGIVKGNDEGGQDNVPLLKDRQEEEQVVASCEHFPLQGLSSKNRNSFSQEEIPGQLIESETVLTTRVGNSDRRQNYLYQESLTEGVPLNQDDQQTVAIKSHKNGNDKENCDNYVAVKDKNEDKFKEGNEENTPVLIETDHEENLKEGNMEKWMKTAIKSSEQSVQHDNNDNGEVEENYYEVDSVASSVDEPSDGLYSEIYGMTTAPADKKVDELPHVKSLTGTSLLLKHVDDENQTSQDHIVDGLVQGTPRTQSCGGRLTKERAAEQGGGQDRRSQAFVKPQLQSTPALYSQGRFQSRQGALVSPAERRRWPGLVPPSPLAISPEHGTSRGLANTRTRGCLQHREWNRTTGALLVRDIPPPFELATITRKPIAKSSPSILMEIEPQDRPSKQSPKKKSSLKRLLPFKISMKKKIDSSQLANELSHCLTKSPEMDRKSLGNSPCIKSKRAQRGKPASPLLTQHTYHGRQKTYKLICRVESFEVHQRPSHSILPLTKPRSISFPSPSSSSCTDYENVLPGSGDYENMTPPVRKSNRTKPSRYISGERSGSTTCGTDSDGYVDMSNFSNLEGKKGTEIDPKRCVTSCHGENSTVQSQSGEGTNQGNRRKELDNVDKESKLQEIAKEMVQSERSFVDSLKLLHVDFREAVEQASQRHGTPLLPPGTLDQILSHLPQLYDLNKLLLADFTQRLNNWQTEHKIADVIVSKGPYLKLYSAYVREFDRNMALFDDMCRSCPRFAALVREFEMSPACGNLPLKHFLLKPVQRIPQYKWLLTDYQRYLTPDSSSDFTDTQAALEIISEVAAHTSSSIRQGDNFQKLMQLQQKLQGTEIVRPGRTLLKEGTLLKLCRKDLQPRVFCLMNDVLLYTSPQGGGKLKLNRIFSLTTVQVYRPVTEAYPNEFHLLSLERSFVLTASSPQERDEWIHAIKQAVEDDAQKRATFLSPPSFTEPSLREVENDGGATGVQSPTEAPSSRCTLCQTEFSLASHPYCCHSCGKVVCHICSKNKLPMRQLREKPVKVCNSCFPPLDDTLDSISVETSGPPASPRRSFPGILNTLKPRAVPGSGMVGGTCSGGSTMLGFVEVSRNGRKPWKQRWLELHNRMLFVYRSSEAISPCDSLSITGLTVTVPVSYGNTDPGAAPVVTFQLLQRDRVCFSLRADADSAQRWAESLQEEFL